MNERLDLLEIRAYDRAWPTLFAQQAQLLTPALAGLLQGPIEHIGSTSVSDLPAKPIIDMLAVIAHYDDFTPMLPRLLDLGWHLAPEPGDEEARKWSVCFPNPEYRTHHLHVVEATSTGWRDWLLFRDFLRTHPAVAAKYAALKKRLASADPSDRVRYRAEKAPLIAEIMVMARTWRPPTDP